MIKAYCSRLALAGYRPTSISARERCLRAFEATLTTPRITTATRYDLEAYLARPLAPESRRAYRAHLRGFFAFCTDEGLLLEDPSLKLPTIRVPRAMPRPLSGDHLALALGPGNSPDAGVAPADVPRRSALS
jgi:site-specific recombinase XerD